VVVEGTPEALRRELGWDAVAIRGEQRDAAAARPLVARRHDVRDATVDGDTVRATVAHGAGSLPALLATLDEHGVAVAEAAVSRPPPHDVYLPHTGPAPPAPRRASS